MKHGCYFHIETATWTAHISVYTVASDWPTGKSLTEHSIDTRLGAGDRGAPLRLQYGRLSFQWSRSSGAYTEKVASGLLLKYVVPCNMCRGVTSYRATATHLIWRCGITLGKDCPGDFLNIMNYMAPPVLACHGQTASSYNHLWEALSQVGVRDTQFLLQCLSLSTAATQDEWRAHSAPSRGLAGTTTASNPSQSQEQAAATPHLPADSPQQGRTPALRLGAERGGRTAASSLLESPKTLGPKHWYSRRASPPLPVRCLRLSTEKVVVCFISLICMSLFSSCFPHLPLAPPSCVLMHYANCFEFFSAYEMQHTKLQPRIWLLPRNVEAFAEAVACNTCWLRRCKVDDKISRLSHKNLRGF